MRKRRPIAVSEMDSEEKKRRGLLTERIRRCAEIAGSADLLAEKSGIPRRSLETYLSGAVEPKALRIAAIAESVGVTADWLLGGVEPTLMSEGEVVDQEEPATAPPGESGAVEEFEDEFAFGGLGTGIAALASSAAQKEERPGLDQEEQFPRVPVEPRKESLPEPGSSQRWGIATSAGEEDYLVIPRIDLRLRPVETVSYRLQGTPANLLRDRLAFHVSWLWTMGLGGKRLALVSLAERGMEPTLSVGDVVLVDLSEREIQSDGTYALQRGVDIIVRRIHIAISHDLYVRGDNPNCREELIRRSDLKMLDVIGRVVWGGHWMG